MVYYPNRINRKNCKKYLPPISYLPFADIARYSPKEIYGHFAPDPSSLARQYVQGISLSQFERDRIVYEGTLRTLQILRDHFDSSDPLLKALENQWKVEIPLTLLAQHFAAFIAKRKADEKADP